MCGPFGIPPKRLKNSKYGLSSSMSSASGAPLPFAWNVLMLTTDAPARSTSAVKSGRLDAAAGLTAAAATTAGGDVAACAEPTGRESRWV